MDAITLFKTLLWFTMCFLIGMLLVNKYRAKIDAFVAGLADRPKPEKKRYKDGGHCATFTVDSKGGVKTETIKRPSAAEFNMRMRTASILSEATPGGYASDYVYHPDEELRPKPKHRIILCRACGWRSVFPMRPTRMVCKHCTAPLRQEDTLPMYGEDIFKE